MNRESKKFLNEMFSLMGRMEGHNTLNESIYEDNASSSKGKLKPQATMKIIKNDNGVLDLHIKIDPVMPHSVSRLQGIYGKRMIQGGESSKKGLVNYNTPTEWIDIIKTVEANKRGKKANTPTSSASGNTSDDSADMDDFDEMLGDVVNEDIDFDFDDMLGDTASDNDNDDSSTTGSVNKMYQWFSNDFIKIMQDLFNVQAADSIYDKKYVDELFDADAMYAKFQGTPEENAGQQFTKTTMDNFAKEIYSYVQANGVDEAINGLPVLNWQSLVYGKALSMRNQAMISNQFSSNPNGRTQPTFVNSPETWYKDYGRRILPSEDNNGYYYWANVAGKKGKKRTLGNIEAQGHDVSKFSDMQGSVVNAAQRRDNRYRPHYMQGYDISQTELVDPNAPDPITTRPGIINNFTGELNNLAKSEMDAREKEYKDKLEKAKEVMAEDEMLSALSDPNMQAKFGNEALKYWISVVGLNIPKIEDVANINEARMVLANNLQKVGVFISKANQLTKEDDANNISYFIAKVISHWLGGVCTDEINRIWGSARPLNLTYQSFKDLLISTLYDMIQTMCEYMSSRILEMKKRLEDAISDQQAAQATQTVDNSGTAQSVSPATVQTQAVNESISKISNLLNDFI